MSSHDVTIAGYLVVLAGIVLLQVVATRTRAPIPSLGELLTRAMRSRTGPCQPIRTTTVPSTMMHAVTGQE